jgi:hypothetical protein
VFGCPDQDSAERVLFEMKARNDAKWDLRMPKAG